MREVTQFDWARMAAFLDGEGSIRVGRQVKNKAVKMRWPIYTLMVAVDNTDLRLMFWLLGLFGGKFGVIHKGTNKRRTCYRWRSDTKKRRWVLENCMPFFILKRKQAELGIALMDTTDGNRRPRSIEKVMAQENICAELNSLNLTRGRHKQATLPMVQ